MGIEVPQLGPRANPRYGVWGRNRPKVWSSLHTFT